MTDAEALALAERDEARVARDAWADAVDKAHFLVDGLRAELVDVRAALAHALSLLETAWEHCPTVGKRCPVGCDACVTLAQLRARAGM